jgi:multicomponent Na+:H+ antiporter subunit G
MTLADVLTVACLVIASFFFLSGTVGVLRFPDALTRLHAVTKADNVGLGFVVLGLMVRADSVLLGAKLLLIWLLTLLASATSAYLIATSVTADRRGTRSERR